MVADFLDQYFTNYVEAEGLKSSHTIRGHLTQLKQGHGELPVAVLEKPGEIARFKGQYRKGRAVATVNRVLAVLRAAVNWGRFQDQSSNSFGNFGAPCPPSLLWSFGETGRRSRRSSAWESLAERRRMARPARLRSFGASARLDADPAVARRGKV